MSAKKKTVAQNTPKDIRLTIGEWRSILELIDDHGGDSNVAVEVTDKIRAGLDTIDERYLEDLK